MGKLAVGCDGVLVGADTVLVCWVLDEGRPDVYCWMDAILSICCVFMCGCELI